MLEVLCEDFRKFIGWRHYEAFIRARPRDQVLNAAVFEHVVELVYESCLHHFWNLRRACRSGIGCSVDAHANATRPISVSICIHSSSLLKFRTALCGRLHSCRGGGGKFHWVSMWRFGRRERRRKMVAA